MQDLQFTVDGRSSPIYNLVRVSIHTCSRKLMQLENRNIDEEDNLCETRHRRGDIIKRTDFREASGEI